MLCSLLSVKIKFLRTQTHIQQLLKNAAFQKLSHCLTESMPYYAVKVGKNPGIYSTWEECQSHITGFSGAVFKKFSTREQALAFIVPDSVAERPKSPIPSRMVSIKGIHSIRELRQQRAEKKPPKVTKRALSPVSPISCASPPIDAGLGPHLNNLARTLNSVRNEASTLAQQCSSSVLSLSRANELVRTLDKASTQLNELNASISGSNVPSAANACSMSSRPPSPKTSKAIPIVYTDGCCISNGRKHPAAGLGVFWGPNDPRNVAERIPGRQTNNRAEILAAEKAIRQAKQSGYSRLVLKTDSQFLINCITKWLPGWKRKGWRTANNKPVLNRDELVLLEQTMQGVKVDWVHVAGHAGIEGNERADQLSKEGALMPLPEEA